MTGVVALSARMLRFRVAAMMWMFFLIGAAFPDGLRGASWKLGLPALALACCYIAATTANDVADADIDRVNRPRDRGRPLVVGDATPAQLLQVHRIAVVGALLLSVPAGAEVTVLVGSFLGIGWAYSRSPLRLSLRPYLAPVALSVAYVLIPIALGVAVSGRSVDGRIVTLAIGLFVLFLARIVLKDHRDRDGDAAFGKQTFLLRHGARVTSAASMVALVIGAAAVGLAVRPAVPLALILFAYVCAIVSRLAVLAQEPDRRSEQIAIGMAARMGNGFVLSVLAWSLLAGEGAPDGVRVLFIAWVAVLYWIAFVTVARRPDDAVIAYKA